MKRIEAAPCSTDNFKHSQYDRLSEDQLVLGSVHFLMAYLNTREAAKCPTLITGIDGEEDTRFYSVNFTILDSDFAPQHDTEATFFFGYWQRRESAKVPIKGGLLRNAYFLPYRDDQFEEDLKTVYELAPGPIE